MNDPTKKEPERFDRAVRAACEATDCDYPKCLCGALAVEVRKAIIEWERPDGRGS